MKPDEIRDLSIKERDEKIQDLEEELFNLRFQVATGKIENPGRIRLIRRDIARIKTIQHQTNGKRPEKGETSPQRETQ
tara:strand:- start:1650 stop:1883 length:234 start_codon:yes stop_codon:yes gene_type:complete